MKNEEIAERIARLEAREEHISKSQDETNEKLDTLIGRFTRYEAKWGGIVMVLSAVLGLVLALKSEILRYFNAR
jgi:tetrahydromethanopterin S-methyltransferase subunit B